jgi:hypothetical protein
MTIQSTRQIGQVIRNAVVFNVKNWRGEMMNSNSLLEAVERLFALLEDRSVDYVLVGGIALLHYVEGRNTEDLDLIVALGDLEKLPEIELESRDPYFARGQMGTLRIDMLLTANPLFAAVREKHTTVQKFLDREVPIATVEGLLLLKLYALPSLYRQGSFARVGIYEADIATLVQAYRPALDRLLDELSAYLGESDLHEVQDIVGEIRGRIDRFQDRSGPD